jgi:hypothetical protein
MLDWLVEVTTAFKCRERTYFLACKLFDDYLVLCANSSPQLSQLDNKDVHGIGLTVLYLASKYEDIRPIHSQVISVKISHSAYSRDVIL